jgi:Zn finger protein HypA/HybF involved in hydrogenase expression
MITYQPATPHSDSIKRPKCAKCGAKTNLFGVEAINSKHELLTFVCPQCQSVETRVGDV